MNVAQVRASHEALVRHGDTLRIEDVPTELPGPGGLLIALEYVGICGTDLQILAGTRPDTAAVLGHEGVGVVVAAGRNAALRTGDRVVFNPVAQISSCEILGHNVDGLFQQYFAVDARGVKCGLVLPAENCTPPICGALIEPLGSIVYAYELISRVVPQLHTAVVFGAGPIGLLAVQLLTTLGIRVLLVHPSGARLSLAVQKNVVSTKNTFMVSEDLPDQILATNGGERVDAALICTSRQGAPAALQQAVEVVRAGGCIDLITNYPELAAAPAGLDTDAIRAVRSANVCGEPREGVYLRANMSGRPIVLTGHRGTSPGHLTEAVRRLQSAGQTYSKLITHVLTLRDAATAIPILALSPERSLSGRDCIKAVIDLGSRAQNPDPGAARGPCSD